MVAAGVTLDADRVLEADQALVGRNATRRSSNARVRELRGFLGAAPLLGEKLVCLKNNKVRVLLNGGLWSVDRVLSKSSTTVRMRLTPEMGAGAVSVKVPMPYFLGTEDTLDWMTKKYNDQFEFGYALTVHKS